MTTGQRIKQRRKQISLSAERLAEILGVSPATVYRYENGDIEKVPGDLLAPIADALRTTPAYLMGWEEAEAEIATNNPGNPNYNIVRIAARDGSYQEKHLTDEQMAAVKAIIDQLPDASDEI